MSDIARRMKALRFLRDIFFISFIIALCSFILMAVILFLGEEYPFSSGSGMAIIVIESILNIGRIVVVILLAITLILTMSINKECRLAFLVAVGAAILSIIAGILIRTGSSRILCYVFSFISELAVAFSTFALIDGVFEKQTRKTPLFQFVIASVCLYAIAALFYFLAYVIKYSAPVFSALVTAGEVCYILSSFIIFLSLHNALKMIDEYEGSEVINNEVE